MKMRKILITLILVLFTVSAFTAIGYEHFTVQENQVYIELLVRLSKEFKAVDSLLEMVRNNYINYRSPINGLLSSYLTHKEYFNQIIIYNDKDEMISAAPGYLNSGRNPPVSVNEGFYLPVKTNSSYTPVIHIVKSIRDQRDYPIGKVLLSIDPVVFGGIIESMIAGYDIDIVVTDKSGTIIFDSDSIEIGRNTLTDPLYQRFPELQALFGQRITVEKRGEDAYTFYATGMGAVKEKHVMWNTINAFGTEIKVCMITR